MVGKSFQPQTNDPIFCNREASTQAPVSEIVGHHYKHSRGLYTLSVPLGLQMRRGRFTPGNPAISFHPPGDYLKVYGEWSC